MAYYGKRNSHDFSVSRMERLLDTFLDHNNAVALRHPNNFSLALRNL